MYTYTYNARVKCHSTTNILSPFNDRVMRCDTPMPLKFCPNNNFDDRIHCNIGGN